MRSIWITLSISIYDSVTFIALSMCLILSQSLRFSIAQSRTWMLSFKIGSIAFCSLFSVLFRICIVRLSFSIRSRCGPRLCTCCSSSLCTCCLPSSSSSTSSHCYRRCSSWPHRYCIPDSSNLAQPLSPISFWFSFLFLFLQVFNIQRLQPSPTWPTATDLESATPGRLLPSDSTLNEHAPNIHKQTHTYTNNAAIKSNPIQNGHLFFQFSRNEIHSNFWNK